MSMSEHQYIATHQNMNSLTVAEMTAWRTIILVLDSGALATLQRSVMHVQKTPDVAVKPKGIPTVVAS